MAARGARSRKVVEKNIEKHEKKQAAEDFVQSFKRSQTSSSGWASLTSRTGKQSAGNRQSSQAASTSSGRSRPASIASSEGRSSKISNFVNKEDQKYVGQRRETIAPRGRGGGVPVQIATINETEMSGALDADIREGARNPVHGPDRRSWAGFKYWRGLGKPTQPYNGFLMDPDLWLPTGDCLIYFAEEASDDEPRPMLRVHKSILRESGSKYIIYCLEQGEIYKNEEFTRPHEFTPPASVSGSSNAAYPLTQTNLSRLALSEPSNTLRGSESFLNPPTPGADVTRFRRNDTRNHPAPRRTELSPPQSNAPSEADFSAPRKEEAEITHEIWFTVPPHIKASSVKRRYNVATRNFIALLYGKPLVGGNYYDMLADLQMVMDTYYELNDVESRWDSTAVIRRYVSERKLDNVRSNIKAALGLLAWCEQPNVQWEDGYMEAFIHTVGMMTENTMESAEYKMLSRVTRHNLENAYGALQLQLIDAEEKLAEFNFNEIWHAQHQPTNNPVWKSMDAFRGFLVDFYAQMYCQWPPKRGKNGRWISREVAQRLQEDFGAMYDYLVDRDVTWQGTEERHTRKWEIVCMQHRADAFCADSFGLPLTDMLVSFDSRHQYQHIPHPYPLLPQQTQMPKVPTSKKFLGGLRNKAKVAATRDSKEQFQMSLAFNGATNINKFGTSFEENDAVDELTRYEKKSLSHPQLQSIDPHDARLGRWILLYGILQVLSTISVDISGVKFSSGVSYFLCCNLAGCPPWSNRTADSPSNTPKLLPASQSRSYCWEAPKRWGPEYSTIHPFTHPQAQMIGQAIGQAYSTELDEGEGRDVLSELDGRSIERHFQSLGLSKHYPQSPLGAENKVLLDTPGVNVPATEGAPAPDVPMRHSRVSRAGSRRERADMEFLVSEVEKAQEPWAGRSYFDDRTSGIY